jgi:4-hydroxybenzoate polyprenyltransferase
MRPIPAGQISVRQAWMFVIFCSAVSFGILISLPPTAVVLGVGSLALVAAYPFMKRITWWPQAWLGLTFNWGALLGFAAQTGRIEVADLMLYAGLFFWTLGYDTIYALQDKDDDALIGVKSTALLFGARAGVFVHGFYVVAFALILASGFTAHPGWPFAFMMLPAGMHLLRQVRRLEIDKPELCEALFRSNRDTGALIAAAFILSSWIWIW